MFNYKLRGSHTSHTTQLSLVWTRKWKKKNLNSCSSFQAYMKSKWWWCVALILLTPLTSTFKIVSYNDSSVLDIEEWAKNNRSELKCNLLKSSNLSITTIRFYGFISISSRLTILMTFQRIFLFVWQWMNIKNREKERRKLFKSSGWQILWALNFIFSPFETKSWRRKNHIKMYEL